MINENTKVTIGFVCLTAGGLIGYGALQAKVTFIEDRQDRQGQYVQKIMDKDDEYRMRLMEKVTDIQDRIGAIEGQLKTLRR